MISCVLSTAVCVFVRGLLDSPVGVRILQWWHAAKARVSAISILPPRLSGFFGVRGVLAVVFDAGVFTDFRWVWTGGCCSFFPWFLCL